MVFLLCEKSALTMDRKSVRSPSSTMRFDRFLITLIGNSFTHSGQTILNSVSGGHALDGHFYVGGHVVIDFSTFTANFELHVSVWGNNVAADARDEFADLHAGDALAVAW